MSNPSPADATSERLDRLDREAKDQAAAAFISQKALKSDIESVKASVESVTVSIERLSHEVTQSMREYDRRLESTNSAFQQKLESSNMMLLEKIDSISGALTSITVQTSKTNWGPMLSAAGVAVSIIVVIGGLVSYAITKPQELSYQYMSQRIEKLESANEQSAAEKTLSALIQEMRKEREMLIDTLKK